MKTNNKFLVLAKVQLQAMLASMKFSTKRSKAVSGTFALAFLAGLCLYISVTYSLSIGSQLHSAGHIELLLTMMAAYAAILGLAFSAFAAQGVVFQGRDADLMLSMPVSPFTVLLAKLTALYMENLVASVFLVLPAGIVCMYYGLGGILFLLRLLIAIAFLAFLPTLLALAAGFLLSWLGGRFANHKFFTILLYLLIFGVVMFVMFRVNISIAMISAETFGADASGIFSGWGVPFQLFQRGVCENWLDLGIFCLAMLIPVLLAAWLFSRNYQTILTGLHTHHKRADYHLTTLNAASHKMALLKKEASRFFGTPIYLLNTGLGLILLIAVGVAAVFMGNRLLGLLAEEGLNPQNIPLFFMAAVIILGLLSTVAVTSSSISLEGNRLWILKEAPISPIEILTIKVLFQVILIAPCLLIGVIGITWGFGFSLGEAALLYLLGLLFGACNALFGLLINLHFPKLDAVNETIIVKQSASALISIFGGMAAAVLCCLMLWKLLEIGGELAAVAGCSLVLLVGVLILWILLSRKGVKLFLEL